MSVIDQGLLISGDIFGEDNVTVKGVVKGSIFLKKGNLSIEETGYVEGEVRAEKVMIAGEIVGNTTATMSLQLTSTAKVLGNLQAAKIAMADGASFSGGLEIKEPTPIEIDIHDFKAMTESDYEKLRKWQTQNKIE